MKFSQINLFCFLQFYQDTLEVDEAKEETVVKEEKPEPSAIKEENANDPESPSDVGVKTEAENDDDNIEDDDGYQPNHEKIELDETSEDNWDAAGRPKGVLVIHSKLKNRTKKSVQWRTDDDLEMHHFFELDETERGDFSFF